MDQNGGEMGTLNKKRPTSCWSDSLVPTHDTYAYRMSFMYVHVGGGAWIFNIPGGATESPSNTFRQLSSGGHWQ